MTLERRAGIFGRRFDPAPNGAQSFWLILSETFPAGLAAAEAGFI